MPTYNYTAINQNGESIKDTLKAGDRSQLLQIIKDRKCYPVKIKEVNEGMNISLPNIFQRVKLKDMAIFCRQFYTMLNSGITIIQCLDILKQQAENKKLAAVSGSLYEDVQKGEALSDGLKKHPNVFPDIMISMVEAGEHSGTLDAIMEKISVHFEKENRVKNKIKSAMVYPVMLSIVAATVVIFLLTFVMPTFFGMFNKSGVELPLPTKILLGLSGFLSNYWYIIFIAGFLIVYGFRTYIKTEKGRKNWDTIKLRIPILKTVISKISTARFTGILSTLLSSGIPLLQAIEIVAKVVSNRVFSESLLNARDEMKKGLSLSVPIKKAGVFPPMVSSMIGIGEEAGTLDDILAKTASFYDEEVEVAMQKMVSIFEPLLIVVMAVIIGFIVVSMALPMFGMFSMVK